MRDLCGHGVGRTIHRAANVPNYHEPSLRTRLSEGLVITISPDYFRWKRAVRPGARSKWTIRTADRSLSAHYEHTLVITRHEPILLTAA